MNNPKNILLGLVALSVLGIGSGCTSDRFAREIPRTDARVLARYEVETTHEDKRVSGYAECTSWFSYLPDTKTSGGFGSDYGALFSGLTTVQALALRAAIAEACKESDSDFLLLPEYEMTTTQYWFFYEYARCTVHGVPAKYGKIRQIPINTVNVETSL